MTEDRGFRGREQGEGKESYVLRIIRDHNNLASLGFGGSEHVQAEDAVMG